MVQPKESCEHILAARSDEFPEVSQTDKTTATDNDDDTVGGFQKPRRSCKPRVRIADGVGWIGRRKYSNDDGYKDVDGSVRMGADGWNSQLRVNDDVSQGGRRGSESKQAMDYQIPEATSRTTRLRKQLPLPLTTSTNLTTMIHRVRPRSTATTPRPGLVPNSYTMPWEARSGGKGCQRKVRRLQGQNVGGGRRTIRRPRRTTTWRKGNLSGL